MTTPDFTQSSTLRNYQGATPTQLTPESARDLVTRAAAAGKLAFLEHRLLERLIGGFRKEYEHNLTLAWEALREYVDGEASASPAPLALAA